jgi:hypothetical protein
VQGRSALGLALDLLRMPRLAEPMRRAPLPPDMLSILQIAGGCQEARDRAEKETGEDAARILQAVTFYIQQVVLHPDADDHRVLGGSPSTPRGLLRQHRNWLLKWLHPDKLGDGWEAVLAQRVNTAWDRIARANGSAPAAGNTPADPVVTPAPRRSARLAFPWIHERHARTGQRARRRWSLLAGAFVLGGVVAFAASHLALPACAGSGWSCTVAAMAGSLRLSD